MTREHGIHSPPPVSDPLSELTHLLVLLPSIDSSCCRPTTDCLSWPLAPLAACYLLRTDFPRLSPLSHLWQWVTSHLPFPSSRGPSVSLRSPFLEAEEGLLALPDTSFHTIWIYLFLKRETILGDIASLKKFSKESSKMDCCLEINGKEMEFKY